MSSIIRNVIFCAQDLNAAHLENPRDPSSPMKSWQHTRAVVTGFYNLDTSYVGSALAYNMYIKRSHLDVGSLPQLRDKTSQRELLLNLSELD